MRLRPSFVAIAVILTAATATTGAGASPSGSLKRCPPGSKPAVIAGVHRCLRPGLRCRRSLDRYYHRYGFHCHTGRLTRRRRTPPAKPPPIGTVAATISVPGDGRVAVGEGAVWAVSAQASDAPPYDVGIDVVKVDPLTDEVVGTTHLGRVPASGIAAGAGGVWVTGYSGTEELVYRLDPTTGARAATVAVARRRSPFPPDLRLAVGFGSVWVTDGTALFRIDASTNSVVAEVGVDVSSLAVGAGSVWAVGRKQGSGDFGLLRIDPVMYAVSLVTDEVCASDVAADASSVWATCVNTLVHVDAARGTVATVRGVPALGSLTPGFGALWGATWDGIGVEVLVRVDAATHDVRLMRHFGQIDGLAAGFDALWVRQPDAVVRLVPTR